MLELWYALAQKDYPEAVEFAHKKYSGWRATWCAAEVAYYNTNGFLPEWAVIIEKVIGVGDSAVFVHRDQKAVI